MSPDPLRFCDVWPPRGSEAGRPWWVVLGEGMAGPYGEQEDLLLADRHSLYTGTLSASEVVRLAFLP